MRRFALPTLLAGAVVATVGAGEALALCEGSATAMTTETRHSNCVSPSDALQWTLNIICLDACGQAWYMPSGVSASVDGACDLITGNFCSPHYYRYSYTNGQYAETSAFPQYLLAGCRDADPVITMGNCPCAPACESDTTTDDSCDGGLRNETDSGTCCQGECTPILLDLGGGAFELSGPEPAVVFDIDADGVAEALSWTRAGGDEAFLALDRDGNGVIDSGAELFGAATEQPPSDDPNGFRALAVFDGADHGGDGDGAITAGDAVFARLLLWVDADRDGVSSPQELRAPAALGIEEIGLDYVLSERRDRWGNRFRWSGRAVGEEGRPVTASDVVFVSAPLQGDTR